jgi:hypothetical protein
MTDDKDLIELCADRMRMLEEALQRAEAGVATPEDWVFIRMECGMPMTHFSTTKLGKNHEFDSV